ncbi:MAG: hypothetical protein JW682_01260 [Campylobacterales bacterium]|jgi:hypothetical protein|nr:hypothetical protein [Campylobacterales bacterium]HEO98183.1 hypothetical protein [Campylobacterota bacterium]
MKEKAALLLKHRLFFPVVIALVGAGLIFYAYNYHIRHLLTEIDTVEQNIRSVNKATLVKEVKALEEKKKKLKEEYDKVRESAKVYDEKIYKDKYTVAVDILETLNSSAFNIYKYDLDRSYDHISLTISGSYLNLIKFFDFLQTIKADIDIEGYKIELKERKMHIDLKIKIGILKI